MLERPPNQDLGGVLAELSLRQASRLADISLCVEVKHATHTIRYLLKCLCTEITANERAVRLNDDTSLFAINDDVLLLAERVELQIFKSLYRGKSERMGQ